MIHVAPDGHMPFVSDSKRSSSVKIKPMYLPVPSYSKISQRSRAKTPLNGQMERRRHESGDDSCTDVKPKENILFEVFVRLRKYIRALTHEKRRGRPHKIVSRPNTAANVRSSRPLPVQRSHPPLRTHYAFKIVHNFNVLEAIIEEPDENICYGIDEMTIGEVPSDEQFAQNTSSQSENLRLDNSENPHT
uniref:Uncharacterized protein n=1 Tax=Mesocestoides corti TaxID=53468 RepID=A0A5K3FHI9_MESCO